MSDEQMIPVVWEDDHNYPCGGDTCILRMIYWKNDDGTKGTYIGSITLRWDDGDLILDYEEDQNPREWMTMLFDLMGMFRHDES